MLVSKIFSVEDLEYHINAGLVTARRHSTNPLTILNYSDKAAFDRVWNDVTMNCRGLIIDDDYNVIARPWKKFFNLGEGFAEFDWDAPVEVTDKMDGSLGILYPEDFGYLGYCGSIATRGSFESEQAQHATKVFARKYSIKVNNSVIGEYTFLFEIVYPANRIVLNYNGLDDLVLLGAVNTEYGYYLGPSEAAALLSWPGPVTEVFAYKTLQEAFSNNDRKNAEGYVVRSGNKMVKLKQVDYIELHRIVTNLNARTVWERLGAGETVLSICDNIPDEFHDFVRETAEELYQKQEVVMDEVLAEYLKVTESLRGEDGLFTRKEFAAAVSKSPNRGYLFSILDGKPIDELVWRTLRPSASKE